MFEKNLQIAYLLDFYGDVLDEHAKTIMKAYYDDDLSLAEIAASEGISRQGIRHIVKRTEEQLLFLEDKLALADRYRDIAKLADKLDAVITALADRFDGEAKDLGTTLEEIKEKILNKGV